MEPTTENPTATGSEPMLTPEEARVLGALLEKEITTPDTYPMTLNGITNACNQRSNRHPSVEWDERIVAAALEGLRRKRLAVMLSMSGARVPKYKHQIGEVLDQLNASTTAVLIELLLRGRQTVGEIRTNTERLHLLPDLAHAEAALAALMDYPTGPLVACLPPGGGRKVKTYAHLLCGEMEAALPATSADSVIAPPPDWKRDIEQEVSRLREEVASLRSELEALKTALG